MMNTLHTTVNFPVSPDAVQEVSVQTGTYSAQYGSYLGVHINAVSKTGGNALHGVLHESVRNDILNAHGRFDQPGRQRIHCVRTSSAARVDGPVFIPKLYNGKNKTFFMFDYQGRRQYSKNTGIYTVMTAPSAEATSAHCSPRPSQSGWRIPSTPNCIVNNIIQPQCIDPHSKEVLNFMAPVPNLPGLTQNLSQAKAAETTGTST